MESCYHERAVRHYSKLLEELGQQLTTDTSLLDFGCGDGELVYQFRKSGVNAYGVDIEDRSTTLLDQLIAERLASNDERVIRIAQIEPYRLPFEDHFFEIVFSDQVMEHVQNYREVLMEMHRVLKPGGTALHIFPPPWRPLEAHTNIPLGGVFRNRPYLTFWALAGVRNVYQKNLTLRETARANYAYLHERTNYLSKQELENCVSELFSDFRFVEREYFKHSPGRARHLYRFPCGDLIYSALRQRVLFLKKR